MESKDRHDEKGKWDPDNDTRLLPELKAIPMRGRKVIILFDSEMEDNISVDDAANDIGNWTRKRGARPHRCTLPSKPNGKKNSAIFLIRHGEQALEDLLKAADVKERPLPSSLLQHESELMCSFTLTERKRLVKALAVVSDVQIIDDTCRVLASNLRIPKDLLTMYQLHGARMGYIFLKSNCCLAPIR